MSAVERVTITLAADLVESIDKIERDRNRFISEAIKRELARRRHAGLLQSLHHPHADTADFLDPELTEWTSDLPEDDGLVNMAAGTPVRWIEGKGWIRERT